MHSLPQTRTCFACGVENPTGLSLQFHTDNTRVETRFEFKPQHTGLSATVHGGLVATVLDELMAWACGVATRRLAYCAEMTVRYTRPVKPSTPLIGRGELVENRKGRIFHAHAEILDESGSLLAEANAKFIPVPAPLQDSVLDDFAADPSAWLDRMGTGR